MNQEHAGNSLAHKRILITGGGGYLASALARLLKDGCEFITRVDRPGASFLPIDGKTKFHDVYGDITQKIDWEALVRNVDIIFHFAAQTSAYAANESPVDDVSINVLPMLHILEACRKHKVKPAVLFASTVTVAGLPERIPVDETHPDNPITIYDLHKQMAENYLKYYIKSEIVNGAILRLTNVYGPGPKSSRSDRGILNMMIRRAISGELLTVYGDGHQVRDYVYVDDVAHAFLVAAENIGKINGRHFVIGSGQGHTITEAMNFVAERAALKTGMRAEVRHVEPPSSQSPIEARNFVADTSAFRKLTGWHARHKLAGGIDLTVEAFL